MLRGYLRLILFSAGLLIGIQVPAFVDQYQKRVDAHFLEAKKNLAGFQATADRQFQGSLDALISYYARSADPVFKSDASSIRGIYDRFRMLQRERDAVSGPLYRAAFHLAFRRNAELLDEAFARYSYTVPLDPAAITWGILVGFVAAFSVELLVLLIAGLSHLVHRSGRRPVAKPVAPVRRRVTS